MKQKCSYLRSQNNNFWINISRINFNTFKVNAVGFEIDNQRLKNLITIYNKTDDSRSLSYIDEIPFYLYKYNYTDIFFLKLYSKDYEHIYINYTSKINKKSKDCLLLAGNKQFIIDKTNHEFLTGLATFMKYSNNVVYGLAIVTAIFIEKFANKFIDIFRLLQFFKYLLLVNMDLGFALKEFFLNSNSNSYRICLNFQNQLFPSLSDMHIFAYV